MKKKTLEEVRVEVGKECYTLLSDTYTSSKVKLHLQCPNGHDCQISWSEFQLKSRCKVCPNPWLPDPTSSKCCRLCGEYKSLSLYARGAATCKACTSTKLNSSRKLANYPPRENSTCTTCLATLPASEFYKDARQPTGIGVQCKACRSIWTARRNYGEEGVVLLLTRDSCGICGIPVEKKNKCIDHNHVTGKVRDILCLKCNMGLGAFNDDSHLLTTAIAYLHKHMEQGEIHD